MSYDIYDKKQLKLESKEVVCPECRKISFYGDWERVKDGKDWGLQCPVCKAICDEE